MTTDRPGFDGTGRWLLAAALLLCGATVFAASDRVCDKVANIAAIQSLDVPMQSLKIDAVDHYQVDTSEDDIEAIDLALIDAESVAPLLSLKPRVASIADRVFSTDPVKASSDDETSHSMSPLAERKLAPTRMTSPVTDSDTDLPEKHEVAVPTMQEQMYRKDI
jgi:hypothetical protein